MNQVMNQNRNERIVRSGDNRLHEFESTRVHPLGVDGFVVGLLEGKCHCHYDVTMMMNHHLLDFCHCSVCKRPDDVDGTGARVYMQHMHTYMYVYAYTTVGTRVGLFDNFLHIFPFFKLIVCLRRSCHTVISAFHVSHSCSMTSRCLCSVS